MRRAQKGSDMTKSSAAIWRRLLISLGVGLALAWVISEAAFQLLNGGDRAPQRIELVIPAGTAARVDAGEMVSLLPPDMTFFVGDVLLVKNEDSAIHQLGPTWAPPGETVSIALQRADRYAYTCSFQSSSYLGFEVREPVTIGTRIVAVLLAGPPMGVLIGLYSLVLRAPR